MNEQNEILDPRSRRPADGLDDLLVAILDQAHADLEGPREICHADCLLEAIPHKHAGPRSHFIDDCARGFLARVQRHVYSDGPEGAVLRAMS
jgi:hypothetical protein